MPRGSARIPRIKPRIGNASRRVLLIGRAMIARMIAAAGASANAAMKSPITNVVKRPLASEFIDSLQKQHSRQLGYFPTKQFEGYIAMGGVLIAESERRGVGYCVSRDRYLKRDELGVIYQLCVAPGEQRKLIGAALIKRCSSAARTGASCIAAGARRTSKRTGSGRAWIRADRVPRRARAKDRVHIFWQRRIRRRGCDHAVLVPRADERRGDPRGSAGAADPAGEEMVG
jgi:GNAT superfamily N-acetyltransferase